MPVEFTLPELGENVEKGDVIRVLVSPGDVVKADQAVLELETDKATIEVPTSVGGKVSEVKVKAGDKVSVGQVVLVLDSAAAGAATPTAARTPPPGRRPSPRPAPPGWSGAPAPAGQGLDDFHPEFAGNHHVVVSALRGLKVRQRYPSVGD